MCLRMAKLRNKNTIDKKQNASTVKRGGRFARGKLMLQQPLLRPNYVRNLYELHEAYELQWGEMLITIPQTYNYDGASIPSIVWPIINSPFSPRVMVAALVHDWLYMTHDVDRKTADLIFDYLLDRSGVSNWKRRVMYAALRLFGGRAWKITARDEIKMQQLNVRLKKRKKRVK